MILLLELLTALFVLFFIADLIEQYGTKSTTTDTKESK